MGCTTTRSVPRATQRRPLPASRRANGFSLLEMLIVVTIVGIVAAFALPNYTRQMEASRRMDAKDALLQLAAEQEKFYMTNSTYAADLSELGFPTELSVNGYYGLSVAADAETFTLTATPASGSPQQKDNGCQEFTLNHQGLRTAKDGDGADAATECWR